jgi:hypothetical protein
VIFALCIASGFASGPVINLDPLLNQGGAINCDEVRKKVSAAREFIYKIGEASTNPGFFSVIGHGINPDLIGMLIPQMITSYFIENQQKSPLFYPPLCPSNSPIGKLHTASADFLSLSHDQQHALASSDAGSFLKKHFALDSTADTTIVHANSVDLKALENAINNYSDAMKTVSF